MQLSMQRVAFGRSIFLAMTSLGSGDAQRRLSAHSLTAACLSGDQFASPAVKPARDDFSNRQG